MNEQRAPQRRRGARRELLRKPQLIERKREHVAYVAPVVHLAGERLLEDVVSPPRGELGAGRKGARDDERGASAEQILSPVAGVVPELARGVVVLDRPPQWPGVVRGPAQFGQRVDRGAGQRGVTGAQLPCKLVGEPSQGQAPLANR